jgi:two-component system NtrC family sensor kinase
MQRWPRLALGDNRKAPMSPNTAVRILVVDDNESVRYATSRVLKKAGFEIVEAEDGTTALTRVHENHPDLVVLDVNLPDMNGYEVCRHIKADSASAMTPVLHLSAKYVDSGAKVIGLESGADGYLTQPVSPDELVATVRALLRIRRAEEEARRQAEEAHAARRELENVLAALREKNHTLEALFRACPLAIMAVDLSGKVTAWNPAAERIFGWQETDVLGRPLPTIPENLRNGTPVGETLAAQGEVLANVETVRQRKDGTRMPVNLSAAPLHGADGRLQGSMIVASDETQRKMAENALRRHEQLVSTGRTASTLAHEINNPLSSIVNLVFLLRQRTDLDESVHEYLRTLDAELGRVSEITRQVLALYRSTPEAVEFNVADILDSALSLYAPNLRERRIEVRREAEHPGTISSSPGEMRQVFSNLICNAIEALEQGGVLRIRVRERRSIRGKSGVQVTIADSGPGIPAGVRERIFEPFFTTKGEKGTGLGLWITQGILQKHGGSIRLRTSTAQSRRGTSFSVLLPQAVKKTESGKPSA